MRNVLVESRFTTRWLKVSESKGRAQLGNTKQRQYFKKQIPLWDRPGLEFYYFAKLPTPHEGRQGCNADFTQIYKQKINRRNETIQDGTW